MTDTADTRLGRAIAPHVAAHAGVSVAVVHAGYAKHRRRLLQDGVVLYEMRRLGPEGLDRQAIGPSGSSAGVWLLSWLPISWLL